MAGKAERHSLRQERPRRRAGSGQAADAPRSAGGRTVLGLAAAAILLAGCETGSEGAHGTAGDRPQASRSVQIVERDVEAPEVFQVTDQGLWDGRPSLGGVWIAHSEVDDPERVIIRNDVTGQFVIGALFRRERENPGPRLQVSSDAAAALGMLAGQPVALNVTALRRQELEDTPPAAAPAADAPTAAAPTAVAAAPDRAAPGAAASSEGAAAQEMAVAAEAEPAEPRRRGLAALFGRRPAEPATDAAGAAGDGIVTTEIDSRPLDNIAATAARSTDPAPAPAAAPAGARSVAAPAGGTPTAAMAPATVAAATGRTAAAAPAATPAAAPSPGAPDRAFVQIGIFSVEANADRAAGMLRAEGLAPTIRREEHRGQASWRVVAGPAATGAERERLLAAVRRLGFQDAYAVRR